MKKLTKIDTTQVPRYPTAKSIEEYRADQEHGPWSKFFCGFSPPNNYWAIGKSLVEPQEGQSYIMERYNRNGEVIYGCFTTSTIQRVDPPDENGVIYFETYNSLYRLEEVEDTEILAT